MSVVSKLKLTSAGQNLLVALRERGRSEDEIEVMSPAELFTEYCEWHGLINWGGALVNVMHAAREATE